MNIVKRTIAIAVISLVFFSFTSWDILLFPQPEHFPKPTYDFKKNQLSGAKFELGRSLFYETGLSVDNSISSGSCHIQSSAFTQHGHDFSHGVEDRLGTRNSPPIMNLAWSKTFFWDGGVFHLDLQSIVPITNPVEMDEEMPNILHKLTSLSKYKKLFANAYGTTEINGERIFKALSQFMLMCVSSDSKYDSVMRKQGPAFSAIEKQGYVLFSKNCSSCHAEPLFTDGSFRYTGLNSKFNTDSGRMNITLDSNDKFRFRVPSLRNLSYTAPYMHDGRFEKLEDVFNHYVSGVINANNLDPNLKKNGVLGIPLTEPDKLALSAFLKTLDDRIFINRKDLSEQF
jgi:cytochrome c peroxidase